MTKRQEKNLLVGLDIGTSKIIALVGECLPDGQIEIIGMGSCPSKGLKKGVVVNIESTILSIQRAVQGAELMGSCQIHSVYTGIAGSHIRSLNSHGIGAIQENEVSQADIERVIEAAKAVAIPADQKILHILPKEYIIDNQAGIRDPIGMSGVRLECRIHIVTGAVSAAQNIVKCVQRCGLQVNDIILEQLASSYAVLNEDEKEIGVCLVDIGGGTSDIAVFTNGAIQHTAVIPIAGDQVTNDIAIALRTPLQSAEEIKLTKASANAKTIPATEMIEVPSPAGDGKGRRVSRHLLAEVVEMRYAELFELIKAELYRSGFESAVASGIVLTGGASQMPEALELAETIFNMPVRLGIPKDIIGLEEVIRNPIYSTGVGLLLHSAQQRMRTPNVRPIGIKGILGRMRAWLTKNF